MRRQRRRAVWPRSALCGAYPNSKRLPPACNSPLSLSLSLPFWPFAIWNVNQSVKFHIEWRRRRCRRRWQMKLTEARCIIEQPTAAQWHQHIHTHTHAHSYRYVFIYGYTHLPLNVPMTRMSNSKWMRANILLGFVGTKRFNRIEICKEREREILW